MNWDYYNELVSLRHSGRINESVSGLFKLYAEETEPTNRAPILMEISNGLAHLGRLEEARDKINEACTILGPDHPLSPCVLLQAARLDMLEENWSGALRKFNGIVKDYGHALATEGNKDLLEEVQRDRGIVLATLGQFAEAIPVLENLRSVDYDRERTLYYLAASKYELKEYENAKRDFQEMLSLQPDPVHEAYAYDYLGKIYYQLGQFARAKNEFEKYLTSRGREKARDGRVLDWLMNSCKHLGLTDDVQRYSEMRRKI